MPSSHITRVHDNNVTYGGVNLNPLVKLIKLFNTTHF